MSMLGKVLAVFNVLAAFLFLYILASDYGQQQGWAYADFRHELVLTGLPVDIEEKDEDGIPNVDKISDSTAQQLFQGVGGQPMKTLRQEVDRVKGKVTTDLASLENEKEKRDKLKQILGPMASTGSERDALMRKIETAKLDELTGETGLLNNLFKAVSSRNQLEEHADPFAVAFQGLELKSGQGLRDPGEMRESVAHLLINCAADDKDRERVAIVVGIKAYANEVNRGADALYGMVQRVRLEMQRDLSGFEARQPQLVKTIQDLAEEILEVEHQLEKQRELYESHNSLAMKRETDLNELKKRLAGARDATVRARELLAKEQKLYFEAEGKVGNRAKENQKLEQEIRAKEKVGGER